MFLIIIPIIFIFIEHPLSFGLILLIKAILVSVFTGIINYNYWFSYILFIVIVGGILVLFLYITRVASNEKFKFSYRLINLIIIIILISILIINLDQYYLETTSINFELNPYLKENYLSLRKYINNPTNKLIYITISYLLITLIIVVKITNIKYGPLRQII